ETFARLQFTGSNDLRARADLPSEIEICKGDEIIDRQQQDHQYAEEIRQLLPRSSTGHRQARLLLKRGSAAGSRPLVSGNAEHAQEKAAVDRLHPDYHRGQTPEQTAERSLPIKRSRALGRPAIKKPKAQSQAG